MKEKEKTFDLQNLVDEVPGGIGIFEINDGKIDLVYLNLAYYRMLGVPKEQRRHDYGNHVLGVVHPEDVCKIDQLISKLMEGASMEDALVRIKAADDKWMWFKLGAAVVERNPKKLTVYVSYTECNELIMMQKEREQAYEEQLRLRKLSTKDTLSVGTFNLSQNRILESESRNSVIDEVSKNISVDEMIKLVLDETGEKTNFPKNCNEMLKRYENGETHFTARYYLPHESSWMETTMDLITNPYTGDVEATGVMRDVSETVRSELVVSKLLEIDYDSIATINILTGVATPFTISNSEIGMRKFLSKQETHENSVKSLEDFFRQYCVPGDVERTIKENSMPVVLEALEKTSVYESLYCVDFGKGVEHKRSLYAYLDANKAYLICAVQNVTELYIKEEEQKEEIERALEKAETANRAKTAFLSRVSHDMRTPLNGILGLTTLLKDNVTDQEIADDLSELKLSGKYLLNLINDTLDMSRIESGRLELHPTVCDGKTLFNTALGLAKSGLEAKRIDFHVHADELPFTVLYVDVERIEQVVMNVLGNAIKFTPEGGKIDVTMTNVSIENGVITDQLTIQDTGIGISEEFLPHIFEAFSQEDATRTSSYQGTGLGMAITKQILQLMGGDISVTSELGKGSCFTITLKMQIASEEQIENWKTNETNVEDSFDLFGKRILLCEDHPLNTQIATRLLEAKGAHVEHAENGKIGVEMYEKSVPGYYDVILMDIRMPVMDGIEATKAIRALPRRDARLIPIIAMTANAFSEDVAQTRDAGMDAHLSKPIQTEMLYKTISSLLHVDHNFRRKTVLVVDDVDINRATIRSSLENDYDILEADNGKSAMKLLERTHGIDVVITDIQMPEMDGIELIKKIRSKEEYRHIVIIANTQFGNTNQEERLLEIGANDFVYKPTTPKIVEMRVRNALRRI